MQQGQNATHALGLDPVFKGGPFFFRFGFFSFHLQDRLAGICFAQAEGLEGQLFFLGHAQGKGIEQACSTTFADIATGNLKSFQSLKQRLDFTPFGRNGQEVDVLLGQHSCERAGGFVDDLS